MRDPQADVVAQVKQRVDIVDVIGEYVSLRRSGRDFVGLCPFHEERTPSFHVSRDKQVFYCFGCHVGGDVITFVQKREEISFREALEQLAARAGVMLPERDPAAERRRGAKDALLRALADAAAFYQRQLQAEAGAAARAYLERRGVDGATAAAFGLGFAPAAWDALTRHLLARGHEARVLVEAGLAQVGKSGRPYDRFRNRLMFPICDERGRVVAFGGRVLDGGEGPKYLNSPETPVFQKRETWYGLHLARESMRARGRAVIVEGYMDCVTAHRHGFTETVASLGTALSEAQASKLARFTRLALIAYDADTAGQAATLRGFEILRGAGVGVRLAALPAGRDPDDLLREEGAEAFRRHLDGALPLVEYLFLLSTRDLDLASVDGKVRAVERLAPALAREPDPIARDQYVQRYADRLGVDIDAVRAAVNNAAAQTLKAPTEGHNSRPGRNTTRSLPPGPARSVVERRIRGEERLERQAEELVLGLLVRGEVPAEAVWSRVEPGWFLPGAHRELAEALRRAEGRRPGEMPAGLGEDAQALAARLLVEFSGETDKTERVLQDCLTRMAKHRVRARCSEIEREIRRLERDGQPVPRDLRVEYAQLLKQVKTPGGGAWGALP
ncbi:MAG: DNA primase [Firmicutes bacterium]|nr:DNA primase [Bacillota bacterium]